MNRYNIDDHKNDIFAVENYGDNKKILIRNIKGEKELLDVLYELDCQEIFMTKEGLEFLENYYGLETISDMILKEIERGVDYKYNDKKDIIKWLEGVVE